jgi:hypothetical protein
MTAGRNGPSAWYGDVPDRSIIERAWVAVADGSLARETVHEWTVPWVEVDATPSLDLMVGLAMTSLHGYDLAVRDPTRPTLLGHGAPGAYLRTLGEVQTELDSWRAECVTYDLDPEAWRARRMAVARAAIAEEMQARAGTDRAILDP